MTQMDKWLFTVQVGSLIVAISMFVVALVAIKRAITVVLTGPPVGVRIEEDLAKKFQTREMCGAQHADMERRLALAEHEVDHLWKTIRQELPEMERRITAANEERSEKIHQRINVVLAGVSRLEGKS